MLNSIYLIFRRLVSSVQQLLKVSKLLWVSWAPVLGIRMPTLRLYYMRLQSLQRSKGFSHRVEKIFEKVYCSLRASTKPSSTTCYSTVFNANIYHTLALSFVGSVANHLKKKLFLFLFLLLFLSRHCQHSFNVAAPTLYALLNVVMLCDSARLDWAHFSSATC